MVDATVSGTAGVEPPPADPTPGYTTTEFWVHLLIVALSGATSILAIVQPGFHLSETLSGYIPTVAAILALGSQAVYTISRHKLKTQSAANYAAWAVAAVQATATATTQLTSATATPAVVINNHPAPAPTVSSDVSGTAAIAASPSNSAGDNLSGTSAQVTAGGDLSVGGVSSSVGVTAAS